MSSSFREAKRPSDIWGVGPQRPLRLSSLTEMAALPQASFASLSPARWPQRPPSLFGLEVCVFLVKKHDVAVSQPLGSLAETPSSLG